MEKVTEAANRFSESGLRSLPAYEWFGMLEQTGTRMSISWRSGYPKLDSRSSDSDHPEKLWKQLEKFEGV